MSTETLCRSCQNQALVPILDLGQTPLANALVAPQDLAAPEAFYPLVLVFCPACSLVQITETVSPELLFGEYPYFSSVSDSFVAHAKALAESLVAERGLGPDSLVVEVASNDGYLLQHYVQAGVPVLGVEPARNIAAVAQAKGVRTLNDFFGHELAKGLAESGLKADVLHANNVMAHVADLNGFMAGIQSLLAPQGVAVVEAPYVKDLIDQVAFDTIYHEHLCYFSLRAVQALAERHGLLVLDVEKLTVHGGSLRYVLGHAGQLPSTRVATLRAEEEAWGVAELAFYQGFGQRVAALKALLTGLLAQLRAEGARLAAYGASAKGSTLMHCFGLGAQELAYVVDRSAAKQGKHCPGNHLEIFPPEKILEDLPSHLLLLSWNFADEILAQQASYRARGGRFILPLPEPRIL